MFIVKENFMYIMEGKGPRTGTSGTQNK